MTFLNTKRVTAQYFCTKHKLLIITPSTGNSKEGLGLMHVGAASEQTQLHMYTCNS